jgi:voltage-gated potassium channel
LGLGVVLLAVGLYLGSEGVLQQPSFFWEALENALIALMGEYPERPHTVFGRILQLVLLILGTGLFGAWIGAISSLFVTHALTHSSKMKPLHDHIIVCNWNNKASRVIEQLLEADRQNPPDIVVVAASPVADALDFEMYTNVHFVQADPTHHHTLEKLRAFYAKSIILLADEESQGPDEKNALIALAVKHLEAIPGKTKDIHVVAELVNLERRRHLKEAGVDELVSAQDYSSGIIAQSAIFRNMSVVYQQLLSYSSDTNEFYFIPPGRYPARFYGQTFPELAHWFIERNRQHPAAPILLVGIKRTNGEILLNPKGDRFQTLAQSDSLIVMAFDYVTEIA